MKKARCVRFLWAGLLLIIAGSAVFAPLLTAYDPMATEPANQFSPPDGEHLLGTDQFGRDVFSRTVWGARHSLASALVSTAIAVGLGLVAGGMAGSMGGRADWVLMRGVDVIFAFPSLLLAMALVAMLGVGSWQVAVAVGVSLAPTYSRVVRAAILSVKNQLFVEAARALGAGSWRIMGRHLLPNAASQISAFATAIYAWSLLNIAALDFLGLTGSPSLPTWGRMLNEGRSFLRIAPWIVLGPGIMLTLSVIAVAGLSDGWLRGATAQGKTKNAAKGVAALFVEEEKKASASSR
jgi:peptide/nickel transport system permease protein